MDTLASVTLWAPDWGTVVSTPATSASPAMHTAFVSVQARAGRRTVTSASPLGVIVSSLTGFAPVAVCRAFVTRPAVTSSTEAASRFGSSPAGAPLSPLLSFVFRSTPVSSSAPTAAGSLFLTAPCRGVAMAWAARASVRATAEMVFIGRFSRLRRPAGVESGTRPLRARDRPS